MHMAKSIDFIRPRPWAPTVCTLKSRFLPWAPPKLLISSQFLLIWCKNIDMKSTFLASCGRPWPWEAEINKNLSGQSWSLTAETQNTLQTIRMIQMCLFRITIKVSVNSESRKQAGTLNFYSKSHHQTCSIISSTVPIAPSNIN